MEEENPLELDDAFFGLLPRKDSLEKSVQDNAVAEEGDIEAEASEAQGPLHTFDKIRDDPQIRILDSSPNVSSHDFLIGLDEEEEMGNRPMKKAKLDSINDHQPHPLHQDSSPKFSSGHTHNSTVIRDSIPSTNSHKHDEELDELELDDTFNLPPPQMTRPENNDSARREASLETMELEVDPSFMAPMDLTPKPPLAPVKQVTREWPTLEPPDDAPHSIPPHPFHPEERVGSTDLLEARWIPTTSLVATKLDGTKIHIPRRRKIGSTQATRGGARSTEALPKNNASNYSTSPFIECYKLSVRRSCIKMPCSQHRYRPVKFIDLIGDERTFRSAMSWLKTWDRCVFKKVESNKRKRMNKAQQPSNSHPQLNSFAEATESDPYGRPQEKVLLLAGKPGLGKTTMAEVLAAQAGYQVVEINASDDRNSKTVTDQIKSALESRTLDAGAKFGGGLSLKSNRPTCVIIDEIDGAGGGGGAEGNESGFVKALVKLVTEGSSNTTTKVNSKGKSLDQRPLLRPIICICNDLYAPVLRPLRPISRIIRFNSPTPLTVVKRLQTICKSEKLVADLNNLNYLVKLASGDLRSCLNTLQFISTQSTTLTDQIIKAALESSVKDSGSSVQTVLSHLFKIPVKKSASKNDASGSKNAYLNELVRDISICGQNERIVQGCFEAYLGMKQPTDLWRTYDRLYDWLEFYDRLEMKIWKEQEYQLAGYVPYSIAIWRELMGNGLTSSFKTTEVVCELLPFLIRILSVDLRPVNMKLFKKEEKDCLARLVSIMQQLGLKFVQDKGEDGQLTYTLEPPVDFPAYYEGKRPLDIPPPRYSVRQMIVNEMTALSRARNQEKPVPGSSNGAPGTAAAIINAYKQKPNGFKAGLPEKVALDFFGRKRIDQPGLVKPSSSGAGEGQPIPKEKVKILYRYHEGFSNAVQKPITFNELILK
ncbi:hypothetical protein PCANC_13984 [Puccinia coronata f. sp. avenae]|uniref:AAA+ ATPase domain-containing protein n=1 Tax=Puccinia coronata f. sp. avenae TaxID=200324 RepID=A0A2N5SL67_9BASI|nr:hypothetical protein PCANC_13984 [Puccinia coronata f. sp. avenae]